jgi:hypothetical protein
MKLHLGFEDHPYETRYKESSPLTRTVKKGRPKVLSRPQQAYGQGKTTAEVAAELETKYGIVEKFYELEEDNIIEMVEEAFGEDIEEVMMMEQPSKTGISVKETDKIEASFRAMLQREELHSRGNVPTLAALRGVSHLKRQPYAKSNPRRPSFIDTGMYQRSFAAWVEDIDEE